MAESAWGAVVGDIVGSRFEGHNYAGKDFELFTEHSRATDDTVLTVATAHAIIENYDQPDYAGSYKAFYQRYPTRGYGPRFRQWAAGNIEGPYHSYGNGSAMRVSPIACAYPNWNRMLREATRSAEVTHNHPEGIKGARTVSLAIHLARNSAGKPEIKQAVEAESGYDLRPTLDEIRPTYRFDATCQGSVPQAITAFLEPNGFEDVIRNAISIGGDSDTIAAIAGSIAGAYYGIPEPLLEQSKCRLDDYLISVMQEFEAMISEYEK